ncbi:hypothetical protein Cni_G27892 [Canna indica]|uniref:Glycosyltransferase n=1 Tax=Canna indica TaxID=4628 RepID=A0AAQ3QSN9_9LILI|nr:hypothetical protein Cni_G27892 [Canna indica]
MELSLFVPSCSRLKKYGKKYYGVRLYRNCVQEIWHEVVQPPFEGTPRPPHPHGRHGYPPRRSRRPRQLHQHPVNAARAATAADACAGVSIDFVELPFPCAAVGLPDGCENLDLLPSLESHHVELFFSAAALLRDPLKQYLLAQPPSSAFMIADACNPWTRFVVGELRMPRLLFYGPSCLYTLCARMIKHHIIWDRYKDDPFEPFDVPGLPHPLRISMARMPWLLTAPGWEGFLEEIVESEATTDGVVINSFDDLERVYVDCYNGNMEGKKVWTLGPLSLVHKDPDNKAARGNRVSIVVGEEHRVIRWLDEKPARSVIYLSFGSVVRHDAAQLMEISHGLEAAGRPFLWVIKEAEASSQEVEKWLSGFEERTAGRGIVVKGWAPQAAILAHMAVGGFMTHCGWNSTIEAVAEGIPMATWPHFGDQFINEMLVVDSLGIGVAVIDGANGRAVVVKREEIAKAAARLMDEGAEGEKRRERARELGRKARKAMEVGGSSYLNFTRLVNFVLDYDRVE